MIEENTGNFSASRHLYDWFQNTSHVIINIMIKNLRESDVRVRLIDDTLDVSCSLANGNLFKLHFNLFKPIYVSESSWSVTPSKLEVKLKKTDRKRWQSLETIPEKGAKRTPAVAGIVEANSPTAKKFAAAMSASDNQPKSDGKPKYDWYQTELYVVVTVMIRNLNADNVNIDYGEQTADLTCKLETDGEYTLKLKLSNPIIPKESSFKVTSSKVELKMKKVDTVRWESLELGSKHEPLHMAVKKNAIQQESRSEAKAAEVSVAKSAPKPVDKPSADKPSADKPSADKPPSFYSKNWDKIVNEFEEEEKDTANQSIDELLKDIYLKGDEETRRAISKSFQESNGTVLSTNWGQVSQSKVDVKPPDGCEFKSWQS